jgi:transposase
MPNEEVPGFLKPYPVEHVAMEATTSIVPLHRRLTGMGYDVHIAHPKKTRTIAKARINTDRTSSRALAELHRVNSLPKSYWPPPHMALLLEKVRRRAFLVRERAKLKTKIRSVLTYEKSSLRRATSSSPGRASSGSGAWGWGRWTATSG